MSHPIILSKAITSTLYEPTNGFDYYFSKKSLFDLPYSLIKVKASYNQIIQYLKEEGILDKLTLNETRCDIFPHFSTSTFFKTKENSSGHGMSTHFSNDYENEVAISKALGEGLERYFLYHPSHSKVTLREKISLTDVKLSHLQNTPTFLKEQTDRVQNIYSFQRNEATKFVTIEMTDLYTKKIFLLPTQYVFWRYKEYDEPYLYNPTTNGAGAHFSRESAILSGLHEELQRDTFLLYWLCKKIPQKIDHQSIQNKESLAIIENLSNKGLKVHVLILTNVYTVPTFITVLEDERKEGSYFVSMGAGTDAGQYEEAIRSSLHEAISVLPINASFRGEVITLTKKYQPFSDYTIGRLERIRMWRGAWAKENISFFLSGKTVSLRTFALQEIIAVSKKDLLKKILPLLTSEFSKVLVYEVTSPILSKLNYHVVRVFLPEALQLHLMEPLATLSSDRLAKALSKKKKDLCVKDFNPLPHPFP